MPCAQGWVCQGFVQPARYLIFSTCMPVSGSSISGIEGSSTPSWGIGNGTHSWVLVSMPVTSTGFSSSDMVDHFLLAITAPRESGPTFHYRERPGRGSSLQACHATPLQRRPLWHRPGQAALSFNHLLRQVEGGVSHPHTKQQRLTAHLA